MSLSRLLPSVRTVARRAPQPAAAAVVAALPAYQVALWPDGWELHADGAVTLRDTHELAEARRWYAMAERNGDARGRAARAADMDRVMGLHGIFVPRPVVCLSGHRFPSERVASVALQLVAGDWIALRRRRLMAAPDQALAQHALAWSGSRHRGAPTPADMQTLLTELLDACVAEGLVPPARYALALRVDDGYGIRAWTCSVQVDLDPYARARAAEALRAALIPWNRAVVRDGRAVPLIALRVEARRAGRAGARPGARG
jgi:hypothetical protein